MYTVVFAGAEQHALKTVRADDLQGALDALYHALGSSENDEDAYFINDKDVGSSFFSVHHRIEKIVDACLNMYAHFEIERYDALGSTKAILIISNTVQPTKMEQEQEPNPPLFVIAGIYDINGNRIKK